MAAGSAILEKPERYRYFDPDLFDTLAPIAAEPTRRGVSFIETGGMLPGALFHSDLLPQSPDKRARYKADCRERFAAADIVFFDPVIAESMAPVAIRAAA